ncbi:MAG: TetR/AcrR family transcriptional regulator [Sphaerospermopsis sp. SIO1G2]|nr:TetR/AcrR family transcriptional regulator [Sphaerospermopsis sp. SIO1G2]
MTKAKTRVLNTAQTLFNQHGYTSVSMRDIADGLGMKQSSLYYHVPAGKEQLYVEVTTRCLAKHHEGICAAIAQFNDLETQLQAVSRWFFSQPPLHLFSMMENDMVELSEENKRQLSDLAYRSLFLPIIEAFEDAVARDEIRFVDPEQFAGMFLTIVEGVSFAHRTKNSSLAPEVMADQTIDVMMNGLRPRDA